MSAPRTSAPQETAAESASSERTVFDYGRNRHLRYLLGVLALVVLFVVVWRLWNSVTNALIMALPILALWLWQYAIEIRAPREIILTASAVELRWRSRSLTVEVSDLIVQEPGFFPRPGGTQFDLVHSAGRITVFSTLRGYRSLIQELARRGVVFPDRYAEPPTQPPDILVV